MKLYSVNEVLAKKDSLHGKQIYIEGTFRFEFEDISLLHWPSAERGDQSIWIQEGNGVFRFNDEKLEPLHAKKIVCLGEIQSLASEWGFGHMGLWPAQIIPRELVYYKRWHEAHGTNET